MERGCLGCFEEQKPRRFYPEARGRACGYVERWVKLSRTLLRRKESAGGANGNQMLTKESDLDRRIMPKLRYDRFREEVTDSAERIGADRDV